MAIPKLVVGTIDGRGVKHAGVLTYSTEPGVEETSDYWPLCGLDTEMFSEFHQPAGTPVTCPKCKAMCKKINAIMPVG
ncbi:MAG: hypothetical protein ACYC63_04925 [Armatimonadota bacterium]